MRLSCFSGKALAAMSSAVFLAAGCVVDSGPTGVRPTVVEPGWDHGIPPRDFIQGGVPLYYNIEPGVAYYPVFVDFPGSCHCIMPMRYYAGAWYAPGNIVVYRGHFPYHHPREEHRRAWQQSHGTYQGQQAFHGRLETGPDHRLRPMPPMNSIHARHPPAPAAPGPSARPGTPPAPQNPVPQAPSPQTQGSKPGAYPGYQGQATQTGAPQGQPATSRHGNSQNQAPQTPAPQLQAPQGTAQQGVPPGARPTAVQGQAPQMTGAPAQTPATRPSSPPPPPSEAPPQAQPQPAAHPHHGGDKGRPACSKEDHDARKC